MFSNLHLKTRFWIALGLLWTVILLCTAIGINGLFNSQKSLELIHAERMKTVEILSEIDTNFNSTRSHIFRAFQHDPINPLHTLHDHPVETHLNAILDNQAKNQKLRAELLAREVDSREAQLRDEFIKCSA